MSIISQTSQTPPITNESETTSSRSISLVNDSIQYIKTHKIQLLFLLLTIIFIIYPYAVPSKYSGIQRGGKTSRMGGLSTIGSSGGHEEKAAPPGDAEKSLKLNPIVAKVKDGIERIGSGIMRGLSVIGSIFLIFGLISLPFVIYAIVFYFVIKRGFNIASTL
jgi:hypothetical protein